MYNFIIYDDISLTLYIIHIIKVTKQMIHFKPKYTHIDDVAIEYPHNFDILMFGVQTGATGGNPNFGQSF